MKTYLIFSLVLCFGSLYSQEQKNDSLSQKKIDIGYEKLAKKDVSTGVVQLKEKELNKVGAINVAQMINGRAAGVQVSTSGRPDMMSEIRIRGGSSLFLSNDPLVVLDGMILGDGMMVLNTLNPYDVEDITILKDGVSNSIYGSRGANGVILITTKKGID